MPSPDVAQAQWAAQPGWTPVPDAPPSEGQPARPPEGAACQASRSSRLTYRG